MDGPGGLASPEGARAGGILHGVAGTKVPQTGWPLPGGLGAGLLDQRIARELVVTLDTVKKHVSHVLGKLGAANRTEAVTRARDLGVIP